MNFVPSTTHNILIPHLSYPEISLNILEEYVPYMPERL